ncbi:MBL fold metallo-hydrolase [Chitinimonas lacunae]|uniref:MBL fold metallo-hydrolase n=1 Tax=Chitinimonas lacunae TaxID=1963018 RepID=A0ABV8MQ14_9NEIS
MFRTLVLASTLTLAAAQAAPLQLKVYNADVNSFHATSTLISGPSEAVVVDAGFTRADAYRIAANVLDSGKTLKAIVVSNADPDYYFGVEVLKSLFPQAEVLAPPAVLDKIRAKLPAKVAFWGPKMGANAPVRPVLPQPLPGNSLTVDGERLEVRGTSGELAHRPYIWVPSLKAIVGNVAVYGDLHVWTADTQKPSERAAWLAQLDEMSALKPAIVVPGHMQAGTPLDGSSIGFTRDYLHRFERSVTEQRHSAGLIAVMKAAYPQAGLELALDIGAKVATGEMKW